MKLSTTKQDSLTVVVLEESRLDASIAPEFKQQMEQIINGDNTQLILDISQLNFMDSSSLGAMVGVLKTLGNHGKMVVVGASGVVLDLFKLTRMDKVFTLEETLEAAKESFMANA